MKLSDLSSTEPIAYLGVDPGLNGAYAVIWPVGVYSASSPVTNAGFIPVTTKRTKRPRKKTKSGKPSVTVDRDYDFVEFARLLRDFRKHAGVNGLRYVAGIERQHARMTDSKSTATAVGRNQGICEALVAAMGWPYVLITPTEWKPRYVSSPISNESASVRRRKSKAASLSMCQSLYPDSGLTLVKHEALAEAILIADYMRRTVAGEDFPITIVRKGRRRERK